MADCRNCGATLSLVFCDLGMHPLANAYLDESELGKPEAFYPLRPLVCESCFLVQLPELVTPAHLFSQDYAYFSGQSQEWVEHCAANARQAHERFKPQRVLEVASNDGTLLREFGGGLGVEPARNVAWHAQLHGVPTIDEFFGRDLAARLIDSGYHADLLVANNVVAHVPDLDDFLGGVEMVLAEDGVASFEFPSLGCLIEGGHWDTIYHEHFSYFTARTFCDALWRRGLYAFDLQELPTHGGSLRIYARRAREVNQYTPPLNDRTTAEYRAGYADPSFLASFAERPAHEKVAALEALSQARRDGPVAAYGAAAKGSTFLNYCGIGPEIVEYVVDSTPAKQGRFMPGSHIPVIAPERFTGRPTTVLILPWNWAHEIERKIGGTPTILRRPFVSSYS